MYSLSVGVSSNSVDITVLAPAPPPVVNLPQVCFGNYVGPLSATPINGFEIEWYDQNNLTSLRTSFKSKSELTSRITLPDPSLAKDRMVLIP